MCNYRCVTIEELKKIDRCNINTGTTLQLKTIINYLIKLYVTLAYHLYFTSAVFAFLLRFLRALDLSVLTCKPRFNAFRIELLTSSDSS